MPWNALLFPLIAGYYLLSYTNYFRFLSERLDNQRLIFESALAGTALGITAYLIKLLFQFGGPRAYEYLLDIMPVKYELIGTSLLTILLSLGISFIWNMNYSMRDGIKRAISERGDEMELIVSDAFHTGSMVLITLSSKKVYVGWMKELPIPSRSRCYRIIPAISGYRDECQKVSFTTHYLTVYAAIVAEGRGSNLLNFGTDISIPISQIAQLGHFDQALYERFNPVREA